MKTEWMVFWMVLVGAAIVWAALSLHGGNMLTAKGAGLSIFTAAGSDSGSMALSDIQAEEQACNGLAQYEPCVLSSPKGYALVGACQVGGDRLLCVPAY